MKTLLEFDSPQIYCDMDGVLCDFVLADRTAKFVELG